MNKTGIIIIGAFAAALLAFCLSPFGRTFLWAVSLRTQVSRAEKSLCDPDVYQPVGNTLALYCQSDQSVFPPYLDSAWYPEKLNQIGHGWGSIQPKSASVEMGGGFHHFGYKLVLDSDRSTSVTNIWNLYFCSEGSSDRLLHNFSMPVQSKIPTSEILEKITATCMLQARADPNHEQPLQNVVQAYLRCNDTRGARTACKTMLKTAPANWWAVLVNALILYGESPESGTKLINDWVKADENFFRYMDLAYFYQLTGKPREAAAAIIKSTAFDANTKWGEGGNSEFRGYTAGMWAYQAGEYDAAIKLCDHLLPVTINGNYAKNGLQTLKAAAQNAKQGNAVLVTAEIPIFDPFPEIDIKTLAGIKQSPIATQIQPGILGE